MAAVTSTFADGCFVFRWNKQKDINEPSQKAIILFDQQQEDLILQVKYEGPAEDFGWLIPVPGEPHVRKGSMEPFYELSQLTQKQFHLGDAVTSAGSRGDSAEPAVKVIEIKTVGAYEVAILSSTNSSALADWLAAHQFNFPKEKQSVLDQYTQRHWYFVAARINPDGDGFVVKPFFARPTTISTGTRNKLASGELHPIIISFPSPKCVFPLAISSVNGAPSEISLYVLSGQPLVSPVVFERKLNAYKKTMNQWPSKRADTLRRQRDMRARIMRDSPLGASRRNEDPNDPPPPAVSDPASLAIPDPLTSDDSENAYSFDLQSLQSMAVDGGSASLKASCHELPRLKGKQWWLTKIVETFPPEDMVDLEFEPAIPFLTQALRHEDAGDAAARCLPQYGALAAPIVLQALNDPDAAVRKRALLPAAEISDPRFADPVLKLLDDPDQVTRRRACYACQANWNRKFAEPLIRRLDDPDRLTAMAAHSCLREHLSDLTVDTAALRQLLARDTPASLLAIEILQTRGQVARSDYLRLLSSTNLPVVSTAFSAVRNNIQLDELTPLMTNSLPMARMMALGALNRVGDKPAVDRIVSMLNDPNEAIRWRVRSSLRHLTGQKLGADPAAYEKWWTENKQAYVTPPLPQRFGIPDRRPPGITDTPTHPPFAP